MKSSRKLTQKIYQYFRSSNLPWIILGILILIELAYFVIQPLWFRTWPRWNQFLLGALIIVFFLLAYLMINRVMDLYEQQERMRVKLLEKEKLIGQSLQRLEAIFQVGRKLVENSNEDEIVDQVLRLSVDLAGAKGASFISLDEHGHPSPAVHYGEVGLSDSDPWLEYLATASVREQCEACDKHELLTTKCPLLSGFAKDASGIYCLLVKSAEREFGILNLYMVEATPIDNATQSFIGALVDEMALALEAVRLRQRELEAFCQVQSIRQKADQSNLLNALLDSVHQSLEADLSVLLVNQQINSDAPIKIYIGSHIRELDPILDGMLNGVIESKKIVRLGDVTSDRDLKSSIRSLLIVPLISDEQSIGAILVGSCRPQGFNQRQSSLLQAVAGQFTLVIQNSKMISKIEFQAMMEERRRLAREIHDGLAQTLGFLKLQAAQLKTYFAKEEFDNFQTALDQFYKNLSDVYIDARHAIDGLRINIEPDGLKDWLLEIAAEFEEITNLHIEFRNFQIKTEVSPEIQSQLMRIVQEALSNVRKHAHASRVWIDCYNDHNDLYLNINDDGRGFEPEDVSGPSQHGLKGMRERADLIGADFQVISGQGNGTEIKVRLPLNTYRVEEVSV